MNHRKPHISENSLHLVSGAVTRVKATITCLLDNNMFTIGQQMLYPYLVSPQATNPLLKVIITCLTGNKYLPFVGLKGNVGTTPLQLLFIGVLHLVATPIFVLQFGINSFWFAAIGNTLLLLCVACYELSAMYYLLWAMCSHATSYIYNNNALVCSSGGEKLRQYLSNL